MESKATAMKTFLISILSLVLCLSASAQTVANVNSGVIASSFPNPMTLTNGMAYNPSSNLLWLNGWRTVGYVQPPSNGWGVLGNYTITESSNGYVSLLITNQYNLQVAQDAILTNNPGWTSTFVTNAQKFRANLRASGTTETNAVVTVDTINWYISQVMSTNALLVLTNLSSYIFMANESGQLLILGQCDTTAHFPWRLIP